MNKHALVVGGSGMLADVCLWLVESGYHVSVIGRDRTRLEALSLRAKYTDQIHPLSIDYTQTDLLRQELNAAISTHGPISLVVAWIHSTAPEALPLIDQIVSNSTSSPWKLFHVRGSQAHKDTRTLPVSPNCLYRQIILGFVLTETSSRWHTNREISSGVIQAIQRDEIRAIVGTVEPWERRP